MNHDHQSITFPEFSSESLYNSTKSKTYLFQAIAVAIILMCLVFSDVIFKGASLRITDQIVGAEQNLPAYSVAPHIFHNDFWWVGYSDYGGALLQSEPMINFMQFCIYSHESPFWNPYSAAGQLGPETLVDQKFSLFTLVNALFKGGSKIFNFMLVFLYIVGTFFVYRIGREKLFFSSLSATAMCVFYVLNGYSTANIGSNISYNYFFIPACLFASFSYFERPCIANLLGSALVFSTLFTFTFFPTTIAFMISIYAIMFGYALTIEKKLKKGSSYWIKIFVLYSISIIIAVLLLSFLYLPILESFKSTGLLNSYSQRRFTSAHWVGIFSLFSPTHFYGSYGMTDPKVFSFVGNTVYHFGVVSLGLIGCAIAKTSQKNSPLIIICFALILFILALIFGFPGLQLVISPIPIVGSLGCQYWWAALIMPMTILIGRGINNLEDKQALIFPTLIIFAIGLFVGSCIWFLYGLDQLDIHRRILALVWIAFLMLVVSLVIIWVQKIKNPLLAQLFLSGLVILMFIQLIVDARFLHYKASEAYLNPPLEIQFIKNNIGFYRTMTLGDELGVMHGVRPELGSAYQIQEISSLNEGVFPNYVDYFHKAVFSKQDYSIYQLFPSLLYIEDKTKENKINWDAINLLGVKYIIVPSYFKNFIEEFLKNGLSIIFKTPTVVIFENKNVVPRAFGVTGISLTNTPNINLPLNYRSHLYVSQIVSYHNANVELQGYAVAPMLVVLTDNWNANWKAQLNSKPVEIVKVNNVFRGIWVPSCKYVINMHYQPSSFILAVILSLTTCLLLLFLFIFKKQIDILLFRKFFDIKPNMSLH